MGRVAAACRPTPVTAKIRLGCTRDTINAIDVAQAVEGAGGAAVTVHGRTAQDMFRGVADWEQIAQIKGHLQRIPLIGNGDLTSAAGGGRGIPPLWLDGVMIGRAALNRPWLFREPCRPGGRTDPAGAVALPAAAAPAGSLPDGDRAVRAGEGHDPDAEIRLLLRGRAARGAECFRSRIAQVGSPEEFAELVQQHFPREPVDSIGTEESA